MDIAVSNGANSISMPDEYVEAAMILQSKNSTTEFLDDYVERKINAAISSFDKGDD